MSWKYGALKDVVCLDLSNGTIENLQNYFKLNTNLQSVTKQYLEENLERNLTKVDASDRVVRIYLYDSFVIATSKFKNEQDVIIEDSFIDEIKKLPIIKESDGLEVVQQFMGNLINNNVVRMDEITHLKLFNYYTQNLNPIKYKIPFFMEHIFGFEIASYNLKMYDMLSPRIYKPIHNDLRNKYPDTKIINNFLIQKIYYLKSIPIAFSAKLIGTNEEEKWFWSEHYLEDLKNIEPIYLTTLFPSYSIDLILDKINEIGINNLTKEELEFLNSNK